MGNEWINKNVEKNLGIWTTDNLSLKKGINKITEDTYLLLRNVTMTFKYRDEGMIKKLITLLIRP